MRVGTATVLAFVMVGAMLVIPARHFDEVFGAFAVGRPWGVVVGVIGVCAAIVIAATAVPPFSSLRQPAPKVIARLVAD
ncbi:hypothetical protein [Aestuariimicrobium ganziense]|uniref:hypothetical protein n=1 Tax=Aestuariimicrobium ganziense TaxID=2773677 RepID=UPI0019415DEE|nr:hypothetical protein [Aestuariimicrobium ganziense]